MDIKDGIFICLCGLVLCTLHILHNVTVIQNKLTKVQQTIQDLEEELFRGRVIVNDLRKYKRHIIGELVLIISKARKDIFKVIERIEAHLSTSDNLLVNNHSPETKYV